MADATFSGATGGFGTRAAARGKNRRRAAPRSETQQQANPKAPPLRAPLHLIGALLSVALILGLSVWGYQLAVRDVSGVPVVRALEGPMRIRPEDPGGQQADFQGLSVNQVPAEGMAGPAPDQLILAPTPVEIADEDTAEPAPLPTATATDLAVAEALAGLDLSAVEDTAAAVVAPEETPVAAPIEVIPARVPGVSRSRWPVPRPRVVEAVGAVVAAETVVPVSASAQVIDVDAGEISPGTRLVQLGAFDSLEEARAEWDSFSAPFAEYFEGRQRVIQEATSGGRTFYRLRVLGFTDLADARRFCSVLLAKEAPCIPVVAR